MPSGYSSRAMRSEASLDAEARPRIDRLSERVPRNVHLLQNRFIERPPVSDELF
jgi:hypothetical protein